MSVLSDLAIWLVNGILYLVWLVVDNALLLAAIPLLSAMIWQAPEAQRAWAGAASALALAGMVIVPVPATAMTLLMAAAGLIAYRLEKFNKPASLWTMVRGIALYGMVCVGFGLFRRLFLPSVTAADPAIQQGLGYLSTLASLSLYILPIGYLALVSQSLFAHPPLQGTADDLIYRYRSRGKP